MNKHACLFLALFALINRPPIDAALTSQDQSKTKDQDTSIRLKSELVQVRAVVTDKNGKAVADLKKEDFELLENNRPQQISFFSVEAVSDQPYERSEGQPAPLRARQEQPARTIVLFVDNIHISFANLVSAKQSLRKFVDEQMTDRDLVALVTSSGSLGLLEQFTRDRQLLRYAIDRLRLWQTPPQETLFTPYLAARVINGDPQAMSTAVQVVRIEDNMNGMSPSILQTYVRGKASQILAEAAYRRRVTLATLQAVIERLSDMPGQRMIALLSEGFTLYGIGGSTETADLTPSITRAVRSGVVIYSLAAQGLQPNTVSASYRGGFGVDTTSLISASERDRQDGLNALAKDTGGEAFFNTNDLNGRLQKALNDNRIYYALAYYPGDNANGKQFRRIALRVKNHPDYKVRTQRGYQPLEVKEEQARTPRQKLVQAMSAPLPATAIPVAASADYLERENDEERVVVQTYIDVNSLQFREQNKHYLSNMDVVIAVYDLAGKRVHLSAKEIVGDFAPERLEVAKHYGYRYAERIALKPGTYQVRVGVLEPATERIGTAIAWVEVPDLGKGKLTLSSIILAREPDENIKTSKAATEANSMSPAATQGVRIYKLGDVLDYDLIIYPETKNGRQETDILMQSEVIQGERQVFQSPWEPITARTTGKDKKGIQVSGRLKLNSLKPGLYELRLSVKGAKATKPLQRSVLFGVEQ